MTFLPPTFVLVIPAYRAVGRLGGVLSEAMKLIAADRILVVDDGSGDGTADEAGARGVHVVVHDRNRGKGAALQTGIDRWLRSDASWQAVITMDADGQHVPGEMASLVETWRRTGADVVVGDRRIRGTNMPLARRLSNAITSTLVSWKSGARIPDSQCGYRLITRRVAEAIRVRSTGFEAETEFILSAVRSGFRVEAAPVSTIYNNERSTMTHWRTTLSFLRVIARGY